MRRWAPRRSAVVWLCLGWFGVSVPLAAQAAPESGTFVVRVGRDTIAVERFHREPGWLGGVLSGARVGAVHYRAHVAADARVPRLELAVRAPGASPAAPPLQEASVVMRNDSAIVETSRGAGPRQTQSFAEAGTFPYLNLSFGMLEQVLRRARKLGGDTVRMELFNVSGGQPIPTVIIWRGADSARVSLGGVETLVSMDRAGRLLGARVPAQDLVVERSGEAVALATRPPDYAAPAGAPYIAEAVSVRTPAGHRLGGTLTLPSGRDADVPAVITISGSGPQDRDSSHPLLPGYRPFRQLADTLARRGIAVLRLDDRGVGASTGDRSRATSADYADDVRAAIAFLRRHPRIDPARIALVGHSEGGLIAPMVATTDSALRTLVLIAAPARRGRTILAEQYRYGFARDRALGVAARDSALAVSMRNVDLLSASDPWVRYFLGYDPLPTARRIRVPVLVLQGATDRQVGAEQAVELGRAIRAGGNADVAVRVLPGIDHLLLADSVGDPSGYYRLPSREVPRPVLGTITEWLVAHLR